MKKEAVKEEEKTITRMLTNLSTTVSHPLPAQLQKTQKEPREYPDCRQEEHSPEGVQGQSISVIHITAVLRTHLPPFMFHLLQRCLRLHFKYSVAARWETDGVTVKYRKDFVFCALNLFATYILYSISSQICDPVISTSYFYSSNNL